MSKYLIYFKLYKIMHQYYLINTTQIKNYLSELDKLDSERVLCWLDLLVENVQNNLFDVMHNNTIMVEVDSDKKEVTLLGDILPTENWKIIFDKEKNNESIYNTFMFAVDYAKQVEWWDNLIKEILPINWIWWIVQKN